MNIIVLSWDLTENSWSLYRSYLQAYDIKIRTDLIYFWIYLNCKVSAQAKSLLFPKEMLITSFSSFDGDTNKYFIQFLTFDERITLEDSKKINKLIPRSYLIFRGYISIISMFEFMRLLVFCVAVSFWWMKSPLILVYWSIDGKKKQPLSFRMNSSLAIGVRIMFSTKKSSCIFSEAYFKYQANVLEKLIIFCWEWRVL